MTPSIESVKFCKEKEEDSCYESVKKYVYILPFIGLHVKIIKKGK